MRQILAGIFAGAIKHRRHNKQRQQHDAAQRDRQRHVENAKPQGDNHNHYKSADQRGDDAQIEMVQRVDVGNDAVQQFTLLITRQTRGESGKSLLKV